jgi:hypothetical protein
MVCLNYDYFVIWIIINVYSHVLCMFIFIFYYLFFAELNGGIIIMFFVKMMLLTFSEVVAI